MENITKAEKNKMALTQGLILGLIYIVLSTSTNLVVGNFIAFYAVKLVGYILYFVLLGILATRIRKANGGYIEFREIFGAIFIMLLVAGTMSYLYNFLYVYVIDPQYMMKIKTSTITFMEHMKMKDDQIEMTSKNFDEQLELAKKFNFGNNVMTFMQAILVDCIFGLIVSAIVKKNKPVFGE